MKSAKDTKGRLNRARVEKKRTPYSSSDEAKLKASTITLSTGAKGGEGK